MATRTLLNIEEFAKLPDEGLLYELDEGELISMAPAAYDHGYMGMEIGRLLANFVKKHSLGRVCNADTGFELAPDTVRAPDVAFVRKGRLHLGRRITYFNGAPDLAVEVFSPSDSVPQLMRKVSQYLAAGAHTIWVVYPETRQVHVFEAGADRILSADANLEAPELLPGFSVRISELFE